MISLFSLISQNSTTGPERKDECKFTQPFQLRIFGFSETTDGALAFCDLTRNSIPTQKILF